MGNEVNKTFYVAVKITKETPGNLEDDVGYGELIKKIKNNISEVVGCTQGVINSYQVGEVEETDNG